MDVTESNRIFARQLIRSITSAGANYRAACRGKSKADFVYKLKIVEEELDESMYWLELIKELNPTADFETLWKEADELVAMTVSSIKTAKQSK